MADEGSGPGDAADIAERGRGGVERQGARRRRAYRFAMMALLHIVIGAIAIALALGQPGQAEPTRTIWTSWPRNSVERGRLWAGLIACAGLSLLAGSAGPRSAPAACPQASASASSCSPAFMAVTSGGVGYFLAFPGLRTVCALHGDSGGSTTDFSTALVRSPLGAPALIALQLTVVSVGIFFMVPRPFQKQFKADFHHFEGAQARQGHQQGLASPRPCGQGHMPWS